MLNKETTDTQVLVVQVLNEFLLYGSRESSHNKEYRLVIETLQEGINNSFITLLQKGIELGILNSNGLRERACVLALTLDNISNHTIIGIQIDIVAVWTETIASILSKKKGI